MLLLNITFIFLRDNVQRNRCSIIDLILNKSEIGGVGQVYYRIKLEHKSYLQATVQNATLQCNVVK